MLNKNKRTVANSLSVSRSSSRRAINSYSSVDQASGSMLRSSRFMSFSCLTKRSLFSSSSFWRTRMRCSSCWMCSCFFWSSSW